MRFVVVLFVAGSPAGGNDRETSTINRCPVAGLRVARGSSSSRRAMPSVRTHPSSRLVLQSRYASRALIKIRLRPTRLRDVGEMVQNEFYSGSVARGLGVHFRLNVVGVPSGTTVTARPAETFLGLSRRFGWQTNGHPLGQ